MFPKRQFLQLQRRSLGDNSFNDPTVSPKLSLLYLALYNQYWLLPPKWQMKYYVKFEIISVAQGEPDKML